MAKGGKAGKGGKPARQDLARNRKVRYDYEILDSKEAGVVLVGTEVKSIRAGNVSLAESFVRFDGSDAYWVSGTIDEYPFGNRLNHDPKRKRKLLLHRQELAKLRDVVRQRGFTVIPIALYLSQRGLIKMEIALMRGKKRFDKRQDEKKKEARRELRREHD